MKIESNEWQSFRLEFIEVGLFWQRLQNGKKKITQQQQDLETLLAPEKASRELKIYFVSFIFVNTSSPDDYPNVCILLSLECT